MLFVWYLWLVKYCWVHINLIVVKVWAVLFPPAKDFILCETLPRLILYGCRFTLFLCCQFIEKLVAFFAVFLSQACFHFLALTLYPSLICYLHSRLDLPFNLFVVSGSFWPPSLFLHIFSVLGISLVRRCPRLSRVQVCVEWPSLRRLSFWT